MRCYCCDSELSDYEATLKSSSTGQYLDTCTTCLSIAGISAVSSPNFVADSEEEENDF